jgi:hypothetical protein
MARRNHRAARLVRGLLLLTLGLAASFAFPARAPADVAQPGTLEDYLAGGKYNGATLGNYIVAATSFDARTSGLTAEGITVTPVVFAPNIVGLQFGTPGFAGNGNGKDLIISWMLSDSGGAQSIKGAFLQMVDVTATGTGLITITDQSVGLSTSLGSGTNTPMAGVEFPATNSVSFSDRLFGQTGFQAGEATIRSYREMINAPEPSSLVLGLIGAVGVAALARYDRRRRTLRSSSPVSRV